MSAVKSPVLSPLKKTGQKEGSQLVRASVDTKKRKTEAPAVVPAQPKLQVKLLSEHGVVPTRGSKQAAGYDLSRYVGPVLQVDQSSFCAVPMM